MQGININEISEKIIELVENCVITYKASPLKKFINIFYDSIHNALHYIWHFFGLYLPTHATLLTIVCSSIGIYFTIKKNRKTAKEKNSLEFDNYCQTNKECSQHYQKVRSICTDVRDENNNIIKALHEERVGVFCTLPERIKEDKKLFEKEGYTKKRIRNLINIKYKDELEYFSSIGFILNMWERCATAIRNDIYDENIIYDIQCRAAIIIYDTFRPYIKSAQKRTDDRVFMNFEWLIKKWKLERCKTDGYTKKEKQAFKAFEKSKYICDYVENKNKSHGKIPIILKIYIRARIFFAERKLNKYKNR